MPKVTLCAYVFAAFIIFVSPANAQEKEDEWDIEITPRFWYMMFNPTPFSDSTFIQQTNETVEFPLYGFSVKVKPAGFTDSDFLLTAFRGSDSVKGRTVTVGGASARHVTDATRTDIELLYRTRFADSNAYWFIGARWTLIEEEATADSGFVFPVSGSNRLNQDTTFYLAEVGASFSTPIDHAGKHLLFGNFTSGIGYEKQEVTNRVAGGDPADHSGAIPFLDANVGYQYSFLPNANVHIRYRSFVLRELKRDEFMALHGPEVGLTVRF
jgi:hypothetical protein